MVAKTQGGNAATVQNREMYDIINYYISYLLILLYPWMTDKWTIISFCNNYSVYLYDYLNIYIYIHIYTLE